MATPTRRHRPGRTLITLGVLVVLLFGGLFAGTRLSDASWTPGLALDLEGGTQLILRPVATNDADVTSATIAQAINIIRQRVDSQGVAEAEISSQSGNNIVVALPGRPDEATLELVRRSAQMDMRPVLQMLNPTPATQDDGAAPEPSASAEPGDGASAAPTDDASQPADDQATDTPSDAASDAPTDAESPSDEPTKATPDSPSDAEYYITPAVQARADALDCTDPANLSGGEPGDPDKAFVTCDPTGTVKYVLGPVEVRGQDIAGATSGLEVLQNGAVGNRWVVNLTFNSRGTAEFTDVTTRLQGLQSPQNQFAMVLDGLVISAPSLDPGVVISDGRAQISGTFTRESAAALANQLNSGSLPLSFEVQSEEQISATLGSEQLQKGLIAGLIGLVLVVLYSLVQYRVLGLLTVGSLVIATIITYGVVAVLSWTQGYRLSLPGVAGLIVAIGITADSFIVYFERIRDELRDGRTLPAAVDRGWERARRTILASDAVNLIAAIVLYQLAVGGVRGFAFTLGLTTIIDIAVVFLFTHPMMILLARTRFFGGGHRMSGLDPKRLGAPGTRYVGRGRVVTGPRTDGPVTEPVTDGPATPVAAEEKVPVGAGVGGPGMTIAERRAAQRAAERAAGSGATASGATASADAGTDVHDEPAPTTPDDPPGEPAPGAGSASTDGSVR